MLVCIIAVGFSQRITNKAYRALAKTRSLSIILILPNTFGDDTSHRLIFTYRSAEICEQFSYNDFCNKN
jgi:hypothetical protein